MTIFRFSTLVAAVSIFGGCSPTGPNPYVCDDSPGFLQHAYDAAGENRVVGQCLQKWGYRLGRAQGANREIADATIAVCREALVQLRTLREKEHPTWKVEDAKADWLAVDSDFREQALFRVVQGRAGNCSDRAKDQK